MNECMCPQGTSASQSAQPKQHRFQSPSLKSLQTSASTHVYAHSPLLTWAPPHCILGLDPQGLRKKHLILFPLPASATHCRGIWCKREGSWCKREDSANASHQERRPPGSVDRKRAWNPEGQHANNQQIHFGLILSSLGCTSPARSHKRERRKTAREGLGVSRAIQASSSPAWADGGGTR